MKDGQLVRKIYVKALDDLPEDNKKYDVLWKANDFHRMHGETMRRYFNDIDWYLQPIEEQESKLKEIMPKDEEIDRQSDKIDFGSYQFVNWFKDGKPTFRFIRGNPLKQPTAFHFIYKWSLWLGWWEIRKFLTDEEMKIALDKYHNR